MIEARGLTKSYGDKLAVDDLSFNIEPGQVTGFLGPNEAGKTTTMRMILGLDRPSAGTVTVNGKPFAGLYSPMREVGALLDAMSPNGPDACPRVPLPPVGVAPKSPRTGRNTARWPL